MNNEKTALLHEKSCKKPFPLFLRGRRSRGGPTTRPIRPKDGAAGTGGKENPQVFLSGLWAADLFPFRAAPKGRAAQPRRSRHKTDPSQGRSRRNRRQRKPPGFLIGLIIPRIFLEGNHQPAERFLLSSTEKVPASLLSFPLTAVPRHDTINLRWERFV